MLPNDPELSHRHKIGIDNAKSAVGKPPKERKTQMNGTTTETRLEYFSTIGGISATESAGAIATITLAIIGLAGVFANIVTPVATIVIGAVFLMEAVLLNTTAKRLNSQSAGRTLRMANGITAGFFGGLAGIVLGILALFQTAPGNHIEVLLAVAVLVYGAALLVGGGAFSRLATTPETSTGTGTMSSGSLLIGLAAVVLGILAIIGLVPMTLVQAGLLSLGGCALFSGSNFASETTT